MVTVPVRLGRLAVVAALLAPLSPAAATPAAPLSALEVQRIKFLTAERVLRRRERERFRRLLDALRAYPLHPYLLYAELDAKRGAARRRATHRFLQAYPDTPLATRVRQRELKRLARKREWRRYLETFRDSGDAVLRCLRLRALHETGEVAAAFAGVTELWLVPRSQHAACDPIFTAWRSAGHLRRHLVWRRIRLAMKAGEPGLAAYLARFLPAGERRWVATWRQVRRRPSLVLGRRRFAGEHPVIEEILADGLARMAFRDPKAAVKAWKTLRARRRFSPAAEAAVQAQVGLALARRHDAEAAAWLRRVPAEHSTRAVDEWRILSALRSGDWRQGLVSIERLDGDAQRTGRWHYWKARALEAMGRRAEARRHFLKVAGERSYYGFLAADRLGLRYQLHDRPLAFGAGELEALAATPGFARARELYALGRLTDFRREWNYLTAAMSSVELARAAKLAQRQGWHGRAILTLGRTGRLDDLALRFPIAYRERLLAQAAAERLDPAWLLAIMRQESAFIADARSPKGALGLMQIMPRTGRSIARSLRTRLTDKRQLLDSDTSIRFGSHYLRRLLNKLYRHPILATAAYNAGPHRVRRWLPRDAEMAADLWIETVPFTETRSYLRRVFMSTTIYERRLGGSPAPLTERFRPIPGRTTRLSARPATGIAAAWASL